MKLLLYLACLTLFCSNSYGQQEFRFSYFDNHNSTGRTGLIASDSCYVAIGNIDEYIRTDTLIYICTDCTHPYDTEIYDIITPDILVVKTDYKGDTLWTKRIGAEGMDVGFTITETRDKGFILGGLDSSYNGNVIKLDKSGKTEWTDRLEKYYPEKIFALDSFYIVAGTKSHVVDGDPDLFATCLDSSGKELWTREYGTSGEDPYLSGIYAEYFNAACLGNKRNILLVGENEHNLVFYDIDFSGNIIWNGRFGNDTLDNAVSVALTSDDNYIILYNYASNPYRYAQPRLLKISETGDKIWEKGYIDYMHYINGTHLEITKDDSFIFSGTNTNQTSFMIKTDNNGIPEWIRYFENDSLNSLFPQYVNETYDKGYYLVGTNKFQKLTMLKTFDKDLVYNIDYEVITDLKEAQTDDHFTVFPNPATNYISIKLNGDSNAGLTVSDLTGKTVFTKVLYEDVSNVDVSDLSDGVYIVKLKIRNRTYFSKLIVTGR